MGAVLRGAVIGAGGGVARLRHIPALQEAERRGTAKIVAVCEPVPAALESAGEQAGVAPDARYLNWQDVIARDDIDVVTIATPNSLHEPIAIAALASGKHVFCEKPLALSLDGAKRMAAAAHESGRQTGVNHRYRWVPSARYLKELIETGELGEIRQGFMNYFNGALIDPTTPSPASSTSRPGRPWC